MTETETRMTLRQWVILEGIRGGIDVVDVAKVVNEVADQSGYIDWDDTQRYDWEWKEINDGGFDPNNPYE